MVVASAVAGLLVGVAIVVGIVALKPGPVPTGAVAIDAVPFATVTRIEAEDGTTQPLPAQASTPLMLTLPVGTHRITLVGPAPDSESRVVTVQVQVDGTVTPSPERFRTMTLDEYFEQYLAPATPVDPTGAVTPPAVPEQTTPTPDAPATGPVNPAPQGAPQ
jgi:hypothetical protein